MTDFYEGAEECLLGGTDWALNWMDCINETDRLTRRRTLPAYLEVTEIFLLPTF